MSINTAISWCVFCEIKSLTTQKGSVLFKYINTLSTTGPTLYPEVKSTILDPNSQKKTPFHSVFKNEVVMHKYNFPLSTWCVSIDKSKYCFSPSQIIQTYTYTLLLVIHTYTPEHTLTYTHTHIQLLSLSAWSVAILLVCSHFI